ncbi:MAG: low-specificity L-threonine aldolase [Vallitaleaceae bacterium]|nr:low-specificity L-threonine aldolase [Vallitaleaceae bacterium]
MRFIDLRSDTVTMPTLAMREAMMHAEVGDDVYGDDPTVIRLEAMAAELMGKEAALFVPSGTMGNQLAIMSHTQRGDEIILGENSHIVVHEVGAAAVLSGVCFRTIKNSDDMIYASDIKRSVRSDDIHVPRTGLICLENALASGAVVPLNIMKEVYEAAQKLSIPVHTDGARIFNAATALGAKPKDIAIYSDSLMFCLSKGLCAPIGSLLLGTAAFIQTARKYRKLLGGGMRQAGVIAACGIVALEQMVERLVEDHDNAKYLASKLSEFSYIKLDMSRVQINMVFFIIEKSQESLDRLQEKFLEKGIKINGQDDGVYRFVTSKDVTRVDIDYVVTCMKEILG